MNLREQRLGFLQMLEYIIEHGAIEFSIRERQPVRLHPLDSQAAAPAVRNRLWVHIHSDRPGAIAHHVAYPTADIQHPAAQVPAHPRIEPEVPIPDRNALAANEAVEVVNVLGHCRSVPRGAANRERTVLRDYRLRSRRLAAATDMTLCVRL